MFKNLFDFIKNPSLVFNFVLWVLYFFIGVLIMKLIFLLLSSDMAFIWKSFLQLKENDKEISRLLVYFKTLDRAIFYCVKNNRFQYSEFQKRRGRK